ncbi:MAG TPA: polymer-forming cytoskeletal protein [Pyrinomonadaceae bacterium]|nr:polymer-forming cytoskeletal protein [Pyrinomonadaceae bacterium]
MLQVTPKLKKDLDNRAVPAASVLPLPARDAAGGGGVGSQKLMNALPATERKANQPLFPASTVTESQRLQTRVPVILGEATFRGMIPVDGIICGQPGQNGGLMSLKQHGRTFFGSEPELNGEITFVDMIRVNGHIAGSVQSKKGTLIVDAAAHVDANVDVAIAVIAGTVTGDIVAHQRVELGPSAKIYGNIWTRSLAIQSGAIFEGVCQMLEDKQDTRAGV